jgi:5,10-methylene-tetrahydrofolate dehydrogenase/methenyl tetrahydrofolate cyclohydrolase
MINAGWNIALTGSDRRFRTVTLQRDMTGGCTGEIVAFVRPEPTRQISPADAELLVRPEEFEGIQALVVGGSRGLGETASKLLAAGGAQVTLTYAQGRAEAEQIQRDLKSVDRNCSDCSPGCSGC